MTRVLLVDDQELVRAGFRLILERAGIEVVGEAGDGLEALEVAQTCQPDVVLMDVRMPRLDGIEATRRLLAKGSGPKVLALTTFDLDEYVYAAVRAGASGFLLKDVKPSDLVHAVEVVARGRRAAGPRADAQAAGAVRQRAVHPVGSRRAGRPAGTRARGARGGGDRRLQRGDRGASCSCPRPP